MTARFEPRPWLAAALLLVLGCSRGQPAPPRDAATGPEKPLDSVIALGERLYFSGEYDGARAIWTGALGQARSRHDSASEARILTWFGNIAYRQGDLALARRLGEEALSFKLRGGITGELWRSYNALGLVAREEGRLVDAEGLFAQADSAARAVGSPRGIASAAANLALVRAELGDYAAARPGLLSARDQARRIPDPRIEGNALNNLGMLEVRVGNAAAAIAPLVEALRLYDSIGYPAGRQQAQGQLATAYLALGEPQRAIALLDSATRLAQDQGLRDEVATNTAVLADIHRQAGDLQRAVELYGRARAASDSIGNPVWAGDYLRGSAQILATLGNLPLARRNGLRALEVHRAAEARQEELADLLLLAYVAHHSGDRRDAGHYLAQAREAAAALGTRIARSSVALLEARLADGAADPAAVMRALARVRADLGRGDYDLDWEAEALRARAYARQGRFDSAGAAGRRAVAAVERTREGYGSELLRSSYVTDRASAYADLVEVLVRQGRMDEALTVADAVHGRALLEHMATAPDTAPGAVGAFTDADRLLHHIRYLSEQLDTETADAAVDSLTRRIERARADFEVIAARRGNLRPQGAALLGAAELDPSELRRTLHPDEAVLEYLVGSNRVLLLVVRSNAVRVFRPPIAPANLEARVRLVRGLLGTTSDGQRARAVLEGLHEALVAPAARSGALDGARRLVVVPHGVLAYLPFAALRDAVTGRYVAQDRAVILASSAASVVALRRGVPRSGTGSEAIGLAALAPLPDELPATRLEVAAVGRAVRRVRTLVGARATEAAVREALAEGRIVHLATHGVLNARNPLFTRLALRPDRRGPSDGQLELHELLGLQVRSPLVFLSGCETALGPAGAVGFVPGDDYLSLAQAFLYAGAGNVIATLWPVEDEGAAAFAERFYRALARLAPAEAVAAAQRQMLADPRFAAPYHWAPYVLTGSGSLAMPVQQLAGRSVRLIADLSRP